MDWKSSVFRFCVLFAGNENSANNALVEAFVQFARKHPTTDQGAPVELFRSAYLFLLPVASSTDMSRGTTFPQVLLTVPPEARAAFILWSMKLSRTDIAEIVGISVGQVSELLLSALFKLREILPPQFFERSDSLNGRKN